MTDFLRESDLIAGVASVGSFLLLVLVLGQPLIFSVPLAVLVYVALRLLLPRPDEAAAAIGEGSRKVAAIEALARGVDPTTRAAARQQLDAIAGLARQILLTIQRDPARRAYARPFLTDYLTPIEAVLTPYVRLSAQNVSLGRSDLADVERDTLPRIQEELTRLNADLYRSDLANLRTGKELVDMMSLPIVTQDRGDQR